jgi:hypothetical protein
MFAVQMEKRNKHNGPMSEASEDEFVGPVNDSGCSKSKLLAGSEVVQACGLVGRILCHICCLK